MVVHCSGERRAMQGGLLARQRPQGRLHGEHLGEPAERPSFPRARCPGSRSALAPSIWLPGGSPAGGGGQSQETLLRWLGVTAQHPRVNTKDLEDSLE